MPEYNNSAKAKRSWRDLTKPVAALTPDKLDQFKAKYFELLTKSPNSSPFLKMDNPSENELDVDENPDQAYMFMSHYSTPGIVFYYLLRKFPSYLIRI